MQNLTTVRAVQGYLGDPVPDFSTLAPLVSSASTAALRYLQRDLFQNTYTETYNGTGTHYLPLRQRPVLSVASVVADGVTVLPSTGPFVVGYNFDEIGLNRIGCWWRRAPQNVVVQYSAGFAPVATSDDPVAIPATPFILASANPYFLSDTGVSFFGGADLVKVSGTPTTGQYNVDSQGNYTFAAADTGRQVVLSYQSFGIPLDVCQAVNEWVGVIFKRRSNLDVRGKTIANETTTFLAGDMPPSTKQVLDMHKTLYPTL